MLFRSDKKSFGIQSGAGFGAKSTSTQVGRVIAFLGNFFIKTPELLIKHVIVSYYVKFKESMALGTTEIVIIVIVVVVLLLLLGCCIARGCKCSGGSGGGGTRWSWDSVSFGSFGGSFGGGGGGGDD